MVPWVETFFPEERKNNKPGGCLIDCQKQQKHFLHLHCVGKEETMLLFVLSTWRNQFNYRRSIEMFRVEVQRGVEWGQKFVIIEAICVNYDLLHPPHPTGKN